MTYWKKRSKEPGENLSTQEPRGDPIAGSIEDFVSLVSLQEVRYYLTDSYSGT